MKIIELIGFFAGFLTVIASIPQVVKSFKTRKTKDLSLGMYIILTTAIFLWFLYGIILNNPVIILTNFICLVLNFIILSLIFKYRIS